jgi:hypothetical protein
MSVTLLRPETLSSPGLRALLRGLSSLSHRQVLELADALSDAGAIGVAERMALWDLVPLRQDLPPWVDAMRHPATPDERIDVLRTLAHASENPDPELARSPRQALRVLRSLRNL